MENNDILIRDRVIELLQQHHYQVYRNANPDIELCFELIAEHLSHQQPNMIIKIIDNIDTMKPPYIHELKLLSSLIRALPVLLAKVNRRDPLEDNVIYNRKELLAINLATFENLLRHPALPLAVAKQGGFFFDVDGEKIQKLREKHNLSRQDLANKLEVTTKTISQYELNKMRASRDHAAFLEKLFGESIVQPSRLEHLGTQIPNSMSIDRELERKTTVKNRDFMGMINEIVEDAGFKTFWTRISPFDLFIYQEDDETHQIINYTFVGGTFVDKKADVSKIESQTSFMRSQLKDPQNKGVIYDEEAVKPQDFKNETVPYIKPQELKFLDDPQEFKRLMKDRSKMRIDWK
jgi:predicted transcriptional regulator